MGTILKTVGSLLGFGGSPKVDTSTETAETTDAQDQATLARGALFETNGGGSGSELTPGQVSNPRGNLFGN